ncbi:MAG: hypothetical protein NW223_08320 [Hyphomicrobiaceae bacterium]|nr:hypothetical protein [Hyphomicrobiaceae bacterium]
MVSLALFYLSYKTTKLLDAQIADYIQNVLKERFSGQAATIVASALGNLVISNAQFQAFRLVLRGALAIAYDLGRTRCHAILLLLCVSGWIAALSEMGVRQGRLTVGDNQAPLLVIFGVTVFTLWFRGRYISAFGQGRQIFDHEVGAALIHLKNE